MIVADQSEVVDFLGRPESWGSVATRIERIETHGSVVFLGGNRALKMKRAVKYDYMDFSTLDRRHDCCVAELAVNRRTAPMLYLGLRAVTREQDGTLALDGAGVPVEWLVEMARFDQDRLFDRLAVTGGLTVPLVERLADVVAQFHSAAEIALRAGGAGAMRDVVSGNTTDLQPYLGSTVDAALVASIIERQEAAVRSHADLLDRRRDSGCVRRCHGDLHLGNICLLDGEPTLFDAIEFNDLFAVIDVLYDVAFTIMDLGHRRLPEFANLLFSRYMAHQSDLGSIALMPLFLSCRAVIRAKVLATLASMQQEHSAEDLAVAADYLRFADDCLRPSAPRLVALGGLSGTGKSTVARLLAPALDRPPGAVVLRSDVQRKLLLGAAPNATLGPEGYRTEVTAQVYAALVRQAGQVLRAGRSVVVDAVHALPEERAALAALAHDCGVRFDGFWLKGPQSLLAERIAGRRDDASDATVAVLDQQMAFDLGPIDWREIPVAGAAADVAAAMRRQLAA